jgi:hypothetical protein
LPCIAIAAISARSIHYKNLPIAQWLQYLEALARFALRGYAQDTYVDHTLGTLLPTILSAFQTRNPDPDDGILRRTLQPGGGPAQRPYPHHTTVSDQDSGSDRRAEAHITFPLAQRQENMYPHDEENNTVPFSSTHAVWPYNSNTNGWSL